MSRTRVILILALALLAGLVLAEAVSWWSRVQEWPLDGGGRGLLACRYDNLVRQGRPRAVYREPRTRLSKVELNPERGDDYSLTLVGFLHITVPGPYVLGTASDDDSWLLVGGLVVEDNHGEHPLKRCMGEVWLGVGPHLITVDYTQRHGDAALELWWQPFWASRPQPLPPDLLTPAAEPLSGLTVQALGYEARQLEARLWGLMGLAWVVLAMGLWPPGGWWRVLALAAAAAPLGVGLWLHLGVDLWGDEITSLNMFSLVPLAKTATFYPFANNHILYNLADNLFLRLLGMAKLSTVFENPFPLRLLAAAYTLGAAAWLYRAMLRRWGFVAAWLAVLALAACLPVANFAAQVRGYSLSLLLAVGLLDLCLGYVERPGWARGAALALCHTALLYAVPSNLYLSAALMMALAGAALAPQRRRAAAMAWAWMAAGLALGAALYLPVWGQVAAAGSTRGLFHYAKTLHQLMPSVLGHLVSGRWLLVAAMLPGAWLLARGRAPGRGVALAGAWLLIAPFLLAWAHGVEPYERTFLVLAPVLAGVMALCLAAPFAAWPALARPKLAMPCLALVLALAWGGFAWSLGEAHQRVESGIASGHPPQDLGAAYFLHRYQPRQTAMTLAGMQGCLSPCREVYDLGGMDSYGLWEHLQHFRVDMTADGRNAAQALAANGCLYAVAHGAHRGPGPRAHPTSRIAPLAGQPQDGFYQIQRMEPVEAVQSRD